ncbi:MAG: response regulator [Saprospiraceae bacterium]|nr:response regulator [Saprospiraceae bacterium]
MNAMPAREQETHILLVEDDPADARLIEIYLEESGFGDWAIDRVQSIHEALDQLAEQDYAIVLLDLTLPDGTGPENIRRIKAEFPDQNVVVLTGFDERVFGLEAVQLGAQDFLVKGDYDENSLAKTLRFSIERQNFIRRLEETQKIARIGSWEFHPDSGRLILSDQVLYLTKPDDNEVKDDVPSAELNQLLRRIHKIALSGREINLDTRIKISGHGERYFHVQCRMTRTSTNQEIVQGILQDVTDRYQTEEMRKARDLARKSTEIREQFIASISHEMRTPMNAIMGLSNVILTGDGVQGEQKQMVQAIRDASDILLGIVNDILDFSAIQAGKIQFREEPFSLRSVCRNLEQILGTKVKDKDLGWKMHIEDQVPDQLIGDKLRMSQILFNLLGNAIKFTEKGQVGLYIELKDRNAEKVELRFRIEDTGIGIPEESQQSIFEDFNRVKYQHKTYEGTGLGLAITRQLVELQQGQIWLESHVGVGTTFYVDLGFAVEPKLTNGHVVNDVLKSSEGAFRGTILVVEDHKMNQLVARKTLERQWPEVQILMAENGQIGLDMLERHHVDLVLMDLQMPVMDGYQATSLIRRHHQARIRQLPVLAMTANAYVSQDPQLHEKGFTDFVLKPFEPEHLFARILQYAPLKAIRL